MLNADDKNISLYANATSYEVSKNDILNTMLKFL